ncbi:MAG: hypothetical protein ACH346_01740 [Chthoniobacterales bacterium]
MQPLYFNPSNPVANNYIGSNPLDTFTMAPTYADPSFFNPSLYQSFTFDQFPSLSLYSTALLSATTLAVSNLSPGPVYTITISSSTEGGTGYRIMEVYSTRVWYSTQFSTFKTDYASFQMLQPLTYSVRFGTELQTVYNVEYYATDTTNTYQEIFSNQVQYYYTYVASYKTSNGDFLGSGQVSTIGTDTAFNSGYISESIIGVTYSYPLSNTPIAVGSSRFVDMMGSNVYTGLLITTNSVIVYENENISSYYSESLSYQVNIANLTAALNSVSTTDDKNESGSGLIVVTQFAWTWYTTTGGWSGSQLTNFSSYLYTQVVNDYLSQNYGGTTITSSSNAITQVNSLITVENNNLSNAQTFLNNSVTSLQSQVSLAGQIITSLSSATQAVIGNI